VTHPEGLTPLHVATTPPVYNEIEHQHISNIKGEKQLFLLVKGIVTLKLIFGMFYLTSMASMM